MSKELEALDNIVWHLKHKGGFELAWSDVEIIEKCIQRNEPMKPKLIDLGHGHFEILCPVCNEYQGFRNDVRESSRVNYCSDCGQKLDWSKEK